MTQVLEGRLEGQDFYDYLIGLPPRNKPEQGDKNWNEYFDKMEAHTVYVGISGRYGQLHIDPKFFKENYKKSLQIFPRLVYSIRNYSRRHFDIVSGGYSMEIFGNCCIPGHMGAEDKWERWRLNRGLPDSKESARRFVKAVGATGFRKLGREIMLYSDVMDVWLSRLFRF
jgi:hypothetical protein